MKKTLPFWISPEQIVKDVSTVDEFANKYRLAERFTGRGEKYAEAIRESHRQDMATLGYTSISKYESVTGKAVYFVPSSTASNEN